MLRSLMRRSLVLRGSKRMAAVAICLSLPVALYAAEKVTFVHWSEVGGHVQINGKLGKPIGTYVTIEGQRAKEDQPIKGGGDRILMVSKVDGVALENPIAIPIHAYKLPANTFCVFKGYEIGEWVGVPDEVIDDTGGLAPQAAWQFTVNFQVVKLVSPTTLEKAS